MADYIATADQVSEVDEEFSVEELEERRRRRKIESLGRLTEAELSELCTAILQRSAPGPLRPTCIVCIRTVENKGELCDPCKQRFKAVRKSARTAEVQSPLCPDCRQPVARAGLRCTACGVAVLRKLVASRRRGRG